MKARIKLRVVKISSLYVLLFTIFFIACKKETVNTQETSTVTDIDGNVYKTVKIGNQWWMAENLKVTRYRNGDSIQYVENKGNFSTDFDSAKWNNLIIGAYSTDFFYNYYTISDSRNIAPQGWHIPTDEEWKILEIFLGMNKDTAEKVNWRGTTEGNKLKSKSDRDWQYSTLGPLYNSSSKVAILYGTNESGFNAVGTGCMMFFGVLGNPGEYSTAFWWTSSQQGNKAWYRYIDLEKPNIFRYYGPKTYGFSIRCIKD